MNKRQLFLLWVLALGLGGAIAYLKFGRKPAVAEQHTRAPGQTVFASFPSADVASIEITGGKDATVNLVKKDGKWTVAERDGFAANTSTVNQLLRTFEELKIAQAIQAGLSVLPRFGLDETAATLDKHGYTVIFKDASGKEIAKAAVDQRKPEGDGGDSPMGGAPPPNGRFVRNYADTSGVYKVGEIFGSLSSEPKSWISPDFIQIEAIKSISVTEPDKPDAIAWKVSRQTADGAFALDGAAKGEALDTAAGDALKNVFSYGRAEDVIPAGKTAGRLETTGKRTAVIDTFDGFTYTLTFTPLKAAPTPPPALAASPDTPQPPNDNYALTIAVKADIAKTRAKDASEKPEEAKAKDTAFEERKKTLADRLAKEQALAGATFEVAKYAVEPLLKDRATLLKKDGAPSISAPPHAPIEAATEPVAIPSTPPVQPETPPAGE